MAIFRQALTAETQRRRERLKLFSLRLCVSAVKKNRRGSALLAVMWLSAALAAFGFSLASTVRGEIERASTDLDSLRAYYIASGAIERASVELLWSVTMPPNRRLIPQASNFIDYAFETGIAHVEFLPEAGKLNANTITGEELNRLLLALGVEPQRAAVITATTIAWRKPGVFTLAVPMNLGVPTFETPHASFQGIEEMLNIQGVTPEIFYGTYLPAPEGAPAGAPRLEARPGLVDCLSVFGAKDTVDINTAQPAVLAALGVPPATIEAIVERRRQMPFTPKDIGSVPAPGGIRFVAEGNSIVTIRATAQVRLPNGGFSDVKRTVAAMVKYMPSGYDSPIHVLRWYDTSYSDARWALAPTPIPFGAAPPPTGGN
jgi:general secretion pathway protein K